MRIENFGNSGFGRNEEPGFNHKLFQMGSAAKSGHSLHRRRIARQVGNIFSRNQKKAPEAIPHKGISEKIRLGINNLNAWAPPSGLAFAIIGAIVFNERSAAQIADNLKSLESKVDGGFKEVNERFKEVDERFDKVDERFNKVDERFNKIDERFDKLEAKLDRIEKIAFFSFGSYGTYLFFKICETKARQ